jgi:hypothetical protein
LRRQGREQIVQAESDVQQVHQTAGWEDVFVVSWLKGYLEIAQKSDILCR